MTRDWREEFTDVTFNDLDISNSSTDNLYHQHGC